MSEAPLILAFAAAAVIDTVLLAILLERRAWRGSLAPLVAVVAGALLLHAGRTVDLWLRASQEAGDGWRLTAQLLTGGGALLIPSALLHTALRLWDSGLQGRLRFDLRYALCYAPLVILLGIPGQLAGAPGASLLEAVGPLLIPYSVWVSLVTLFAAAGLFALRDGSRRVRVQGFLTKASLWLGLWTRDVLDPQLLGRSASGLARRVCAAGRLGPHGAGLAVRSARGAVPFLDADGRASRRAVDGGRGRGLVPNPDPGLTTADAAVRRRGAHGPRGRGPARGGRGLWAGTFGASASCGQARGGAAGALGRAGVASGPISRAAFAAQLFCIVSHFTRNCCTSRSSREEICCISVAAELTCWAPEVASLAEPLTP